ncbi:MAG: GNAT family N-acetyltransferase [Acutalibacteraceae bacterium]
MNIRKAEQRDIPKIGDLLLQISKVHHEGRPDLFNVGRKYSDEQVKTIIADESTPVFVATDTDDIVVGYAFCIFKQHKEDSVMTDIKTLYIDDLCVDNAYRGQHIGTELYHAVVEFAKQSGCYNITLNVWSCNESAQRFYEKCGFKPQKIGMEIIL